MSYAATAQRAAATLARKGAPFLITQKKVTARDIVAQTSTGTTAKTQTVNAVILPATLTRDMTFDERAQARTSRRLVYLAALQSDGSALAFAIEDDCTITLDAAPWRLAGVSGFKPDNVTDVLFTAEAHR